MNKILLGFLFYIAITLPTFAALQPGDTAPNFQVRASLAGEEFDYSLEEALSQGPVVVYFYPSAFTRGCNIQAHEFAVNMEEFVTAGASVIGVSLDSIERLNDFSADPEYCAGELAVASDITGMVTQSYDLAVRQRREGMTDTRGVTVDHNLAERVTFIVLPNGIIAETIGGISPLENVQQSLEAVQQLQ
ncbi:MAG: redoxin domain-containing protein [Gammaproteobacteria bacterium]|nr:redoxin domain-containing protein [Gammaproteobacteria bacterium]